MPEAPRPLPRRFYRTVAVVADSGGHGIVLDGRPIFTPRRSRLSVPWRRLAEAIAGEWEAQQETIRPDDMPATRLANSALDAVAAAREETVDEIVKFAASDLLFYRAEGPAALVERQARLWDPIVAWAGEIAGARFLLAEGVMHVEQPAAALAAIRGEVEGLGDLPLAALHVATTLTGSALLALALCKRRIGRDAAWAAAHVDEDWQISQWGEDAEAASRRAALARDFAAAALVLELAGEGDA